MLAEIQLSQYILFVVTFMYINVFNCVYGDMKLPDNMPLCKRSDPNLNECLKDAIQKSYPVLVKGLPQFDLPPLDPLRIHEILMSQEDGGSIHIRLLLTHSDLKGLSDLEIMSVEADWDNYRIKINVKVNTLTMVGDYDVNGKIMVLPINGTGRYNFTLEGGVAHAELIGKGVNKNGMMYMDIEDVKWDYQTDHLYILLENLFNGDKGRSDNMNAFLNEHWREVNEELKEVRSKALGDSYKELAKHIFDNIPLDYIAIS